MIRLVQRLFYHTELMQIKVKVLNIRVIPYIKSGTWLSKGQARSSRSPGIKMSRKTVWIERGGVWEKDIPFRGSCRRRQVSVSKYNRDLGAFNPLRTFSRSDLGANICENSWDFLAKRIPCGLGSLLSSQIYITCKLRTLRVLTWVSLFFFFCCSYTTKDQQ